MTLLSVSGPCRASAEPTTTINDSTPPGVMARLSDLEVVLDTVRDDGVRLLVAQGVRKPGTRAPIHYHEFAGTTCVLSGMMTQFAEGEAPSDHPAGSCYELPAQVRMTAANLGTEDVQLVNTFVLPTDATVTIVLEPDWPDLSDPTG